jgi:hypothetical protein
LLIPKTPRAKSLRSRTPSSPFRTGIHIEKINEPFLYKERGTPAQYGAGMKLAIERGWLWMHESGTYVSFTPAGSELFA